jgi:hypothetical protein
MDLNEVPQTPLTIALLSDIFSDIIMDMNEVLQIPLAWRPLLSH